MFHLLSYEKLRIKSTHCKCQTSTKVSSCQGQQQPIVRPHLNPTRPNNFTSSFTSLINLIFPPLGKIISPSLNIVFASFKLSFIDLPCKGATGSRVNVCSVSNHKPTSLWKQKQCVVFHMTNETKQRDCLSHSLLPCDVMC